MSEDDKVTLTMKELATILHALDRLAIALSRSDYVWDTDSRKAYLNSTEIIEEKLKHGTGNENKKRNKVR